MPRSAAQTARDEARAAAVAELYRAQSRTWNNWVSNTSATSITWGAWAAQTSTVTANSVTAAWAGWCGSSNSGTVTTNGITGGLVWSNWLQGQSPAGEPMGWGYRCTHPITRAEHDADMERRRVAKVNRFKQALVDDVRALERKKAEARAELLLAQHLTEEQRWDRETKGFFLVEVKSGRRYKVERNGQHGNVKLVDAKGADLASFCIQPGLTVPDADAHLAQKLLLLIDEEQFIRTANISYKSEKARRELEAIKQAPRALPRAA